MDAENNKAKFVIKIASFTLAFFEDFGSSEIFKMIYLRTPVQTNQSLNQ